MSEMEFYLNRNTYEGADGSSLSEARCKQIVMLYDFLKDMPRMSYVDLQDSTVDSELFTSRSVLRTFCPLLKKLAFVKYDQYFEFTEDGETFVKIQKAIYDNQALAKIDSQYKTSLNTLLQTKSELIRLGLMSMYENYQEHKLWHVLRMLGYADKFYWSDYLYSLKCVFEDRRSYSETSYFIEHNRELGVEYFAYNIQGTPIANTSCCYIRSLLQEADIILTSSNKYAALTENGKKFIQNIGLWK